MKRLWNWFRSTRVPDSLRGAPVRARLKTYSAETGYVYQYVFLGYRQVLQPPGTEFVFEATWDRNENFSVVIRLLDSAVADCEVRIERELMGTERYALAKMTLFWAFDGQPPGKLTGPFVPDGEQMEAHLRVLDRIA